MWGFQTIPANTYGECSFLPIPPLDYGHLSVQVRARSVEDVVRMAVVCCGAIGMRVTGSAIMRVRVWEGHGRVVYRHGEVMALSQKLHHPTRKEAVRAQSGLETWNNVSTQLD